MAVIVDAACGIFILFQPANETHKKTGIPFRVQHNEIYKKSSTIKYNLQYHILHKKRMQYSGLMMKKISSRHKKI